MLGQASVWGGGAQVKQMRTLSYRWLIQLMRDYLMGGNVGS